MTNELIGFVILPIFNLMNCLHWAVISPHSICFVVWVPIVESFIKFGSAWGLGGGGRGVAKKN